MRNKIIVQFASGRKALRIEEVQVIPSVEFNVDSFDYFTEQFLDIWAGLIDHTINFDLLADLHG